jgi:type II secretory pathway pseudopilin PulG
MVNWATALNCKRCSYVFQTAAATTTVVAQATASVPISPQEPVPDTIVQPQFAESNYSPQFNQPAFQPQIGWGNNQQSNQNYGRNYGQYYGQNYRQPNLPTANPKIGLAVTSMIFGILAIATTIFLIGMLFAPIGLILGIVSLVKANKKPNQYGGKGFAIAGIATSALVTLFIPIVLAIAIPNLMAARRIANEMSAIKVMQTLADAETKYRKGVGKGTCADLKTLIGSNSIEKVLEKDEKNGYRFMIVNYPLGGCEITGTPKTTSDGDRSFYFSTDDSLIRVAKKNGKPADKNDPLLGDIQEEFTKPKTSAVTFEGAAISDLRTIQGAQTTYVATSGAGKCCADFPTLAQLGLVKPDLSDGEDAGYRFKITRVTDSNFEITATPVSGSATSRSFFISPLDGLRGAVKNGLPADKSDPPVE